MNAALKDIDTEICYYVDYIFDANYIDPDVIIDLAEMNDYIGTSFPRPLVYIKDCLINDYIIMKDKHLKINLTNGVSAIIWSIDETVKDRIQKGEKITINFVGKCTINDFNWEKNPQLIVEDFEIIETKEEIKSGNPIADWGF